MRDIASEEDGYNISLEARSTAAVADDQTEGEEDDDDVMLEDICEVVISLKCKQCQFLCNDKSTLAIHIKQTHSKRRKGTECNNKSKQLLNNAKDDKNDNDKKHPPENGHHVVTKESCTESVSSATSVIVDTSKAREKSDKHASKTTTQVSKKSKRKKEPHRRRRDEDDDRFPGTNQPNQSSSSAIIKSNGDSSGGASIVETAEADESVEDVFLCAECDIVFSSREMCCSHMHKVHGLKQFSADFIQEEIISKPTEEAQHSKKGRKTKFPKQFASEYGAVVPKKFRVTKDVFHTCSKCPIKFESVEVMKFHEQCHQSNGTDKFVGQNVKRNGMRNGKSNVDEDVVMGMASHGKGFICPVCESNGVSSQRFPKWGPCSWHLWKEHRIDCELYTCTVCNQFKSHLIARVKDHEQLHSTKASYKCKTCNKTFKQLKQLRCHEKYHKDNSTKLAPEKDSRWYTPKECPICKRVLSDSKCLKKHISAVHNKLKPYGCHICGHTSARKAELQLHVRQHTGEKPYKCPMCPFQTGDHNSLRKHKLRHSDERPYACSYCEYRCIQSCAFKKHILACHPGQEVVFLCQLCSHKSVNETLFAAHQKDHAEGRIAVENLTEPEVVTADISSPPPSTCTQSNSKNGSKPVKYWSGDEDSLDIIDNGGVTIPASPPQPSTPDANIYCKTEITATKHLLKSAPVENAKQAPNNLRRTPPSLLSLETHNTNRKLKGSTSNGVSSKSQPGSSKGTQQKELSTIPSSSNGRSTSLMHQDRQFLVPQGFRVVATATVSSLPSLPSPRLERANPLVVSSSSTNTASEDTESSSSEVITNPHQLIQNIQLTPLDLTDIISCNEQSNDDGMLQRLLDMSGV